MANINTGLAQGERLGDFWGRAPPLFFLKKKNQIKKNTFSNIRNL